MRQKSKRDDEETGSARAERIENARNEPQKQKHGEMCGKRIKEGDNHLREKEKGR